MGGHEKSLGIDLIAEILMVSTMFYIDFRYFPASPLPLGFNSAQQEP
jgi:hypothetical protein